MTTSLRTPDETRAQSTAATRWGVPPMRLGERRVLHPSRWRWLRAMAWMVALFLLTSAAFGLLLKWAVDHLPASAPAQFTGLLGACVAALGCYALASGSVRGAPRVSWRTGPPPSGSSPGRSWAWG